MVRQRGRKDSQTPSTKSMPNNSNLDYKRKLTTISLSPRIDRKFNTKSRSPSYDKMEIISIGTEEMEKDEIRKISTSSKPSLSPVNEGMFFFSLYIFLYSNWILDVQFFFQVQSQNSKSLEWQNQRMPQKGAREMHIAPLAEALWVQLSSYKKSCKILLTLCSFYDST